MRSASVVYDAPARFDDMLEVFVRTKRIGRTSITNEYCAYRVEDDLLMCTADQTLVLVAVPSGGRRRSPTSTGARSRISKAPTSRRRSRGMSATVDVYRGALEAVDRIVNRESEADEVLRKTVDVLHDRFERYSWVGIYLVEGDDLVLGPWKGPQATEHVRIPIGQGICGAAAASGVTEVVDDVNADDRYLACFVSTRSEIVVPIAYEGRVVGEIDIDSDVPAAFGPEDRTFLERVALLISPHCLVGWDTGGREWRP